jgi:hypothetical protein
MFWWRGGDRFARLSSHRVSFRQKSEPLSLRPKKSRVQKTLKPSPAVICKTLDKYVFVQSLKNKGVDKIFKNLDLSPGDTLENREPGQIAWGYSLLA